MFDKIDVRPILRGHLATLRINGQFGDSIAKGDALLFGFIPLVTAAVVLVARFRFRVDAVNGFLNVFSILTGLLLNLLVLVLTLSGAKTPDGVDAGKRIKLIKEIFANICFAVFEAVIVVCVSICSLSYMRSQQGATTGLIATFLLVALTVNFVLTLFMVLKRMYALVNRELKSGSQSNAA